MHIYAVGKQWMWKFQHLEGQREINELHIPVGPADQGDDQLRGRDPQPVLPVVPHQDRRHSRPLHRAVVRGDEAGHVPHLLRGVLRHQPLRHDRHGHRDGAGRSTRRGCRAAASEGTLAQRGAKLFTDLACVDLPPRHRAGPRPVAEGHRRHDRRPAGRVDGGGR